MSNGLLICDGDLVVPFQIRFQRHVPFMKVAPCPFGDAVTQTFEVCALMISIPNQAIKHCLDRLVVINYLRQGWTPVRFENALFKGMMMAH